VRIGLLSKRFPDSGWLMSSLPIGSLDARIANVGLALRLLTGSPDDLSFDLDRFANSLPSLEHMPQVSTHVLGNKRRLNLPPRHRRRRRRMRRTGPSALEL
jgi:hypothetical protein